MLLLLLSFVFFVYAQGNTTVLDPSDLVKPPQEIKGGFKVAVNGPKVEVIPLAGLPQAEEALWSSWGNGCFASNGKYYMAVGDHRGYDGNSLVYEYDPASGSLKRIVDVAQAIGQKKGDYGHGKIHAQIHEYLGALYFSTYRGKASQVEEAFKKGYKGSILLRYDLKTQKLENLGAIAPAEGLPASILDSKRGLLYFYTVEKGDLLVYDLNRKAVRFKGGSGLIALYRCFLLGNDGKVYFTNDKGKLSYYSPDKNSIFETSLMLPGTENTLRAGTRMASNGKIWGMTKAGRLFEVDPAKQVVKDLGPNFLTGDYTAAMVLSPDEKYVYFAPGAHGSAALVGTPVIQYEIATGARKVIAFLRDSMIKKATYYIAGNYNMQIDSKGTALYCTFNGAKYMGGKDQKKFGLPCVVVIRIPEAERK